MSKRVINAKSVSSVLNVKANTSKDKKIDSNKAVTVDFEEVKADEKPQELRAIDEKQISSEVTEKNALKEETKEVVQTLKTEPKREPTLQEFKDRATILYLLQEKHTGLIEKRNRLDHFQISHDNNNAEIVVRDAKGLEFKSTSAKTIGQFLDFCKAEFTEVIAETEANLMKAFAIQ